MIVVIIWLFDHFTLKPVPSVNDIWIITFVNHLHVWVTKFKPLFMFFKLTWNNVIWVNFSAILFDEIQHVVKISTASYVPVCYDLFIELQNFLLMFFIYKLKAFYLFVMACDSLLMFFQYFSMPFLVSHFTKTTALRFLERTTTSIGISRLINIS